MKVLERGHIYQLENRAVPEDWNHAGTPNVLIADTDDDAALPDEDQESAPADEGKKPVQQQDEQLQKAVQVLKSRAS